MAHKDTCFLCLLYTLTLSKRIWPGKESYVVLCFCWHFLQQCLTGWQLLLCLKEEVPSLFPRNLRTWWDESVLAALCPADAAHVRFSTPFSILLQNDLSNHIWSNKSSCLHLLSCVNCIVDAETVTGLPDAWGRVEFLFPGALTLSKASLKEVRFDCTASSAVTSVFGFGSFFWDLLLSLKSVWLELGWVN